MTKSGCPGRRACKLEVPSLCVGLNQLSSVGLILNLGVKTGFVVMHFHPRALLYFYLVGNIGGRYEHSFISMANWGYLYFFALE